MVHNISWGVTGYDFFKKNIVFLSLKIEIAKADEMPHISLFAKIPV